MLTNPDISLKPLLYSHIDIHAQVLLVNCSFESGEYFALDMGGTNFRTVYVKLSDKHGQMVLAWRLLSYRLSVM